MSHGTSGNLAIRWVECHSYPSELASPPSRQDGLALTDRHNFQAVDEAVGGRPLTAPNAE